MVLPTSDALAYDTPTYRLLGDLGHDVTCAGSPGQALELINSEHTDLLVVDVTNGSNREVFQSLMDLPESKHPAQIAVFSDNIDGPLREWRRKSPAHVHVFLKPLHVHGLLTVLRQMDRKQHMAADA